MDDTGFELDVQQLMVGYLRDFQQTLSELESSFRDIEDSKEIIKGALQAAEKFYDADRAYVLEIDMDLHIGVNTYEWCSEDAPAELIHSQRIPLELIPRLEVCLKQNEPLIIRDVEDIRISYPSEYQELMQQNISSMMAVPYLDEQTTHTEHFLVLPVLSLYQSSKETPLSVENYPLLPKSISH